MSELSRDFKGIWIPREIWSYPNVSRLAKNLWAEINSLHDREVGGCWASDEYLMAFAEIKLSRLHEMMKELKDAGLLEKVSFDGRRRIIRAVMPLIEYSNKQPSGKPEPSLPPIGTVEPSLPENRNPDVRKTGTPSYIENKDKNNKPYSPLRKNAPAVASVCVDSLISHGKFVKLIAKDYESLCEAHSKDSVNQIIEEMNDYLSASGKKPYRDYAAAIRQWLRKRKDSQSATKGNDTKNENLAKSIKESYPVAVKNGKIIVSASYIEFQPGGNHSGYHIKFNEDGFEQKVLHAMRKMGLPTDRLDKLI